MDPSALQSAAGSWGADLRAAGVTMNLAPVADLVPDPRAPNPPIGDLDRQYGSDPGSIIAHAGAFALGMRAAGVTPVLKHFPGLGTTRANTDFTAKVVDGSIGSDSASVATFAALLGEGRPAVMMSTAYYPRIDGSAPAAFSPVVVEGLLRDELGFEGVVMTDDVSATAQVAAWSPGDRAVNAIAAGCDLVLASADAGVAPEMYQALLAKAEADPAFAARVTEAASRVLALKALVG